MIVRIMPLHLLMVALCCRQSADGFLFFPQVRNKPGAMVLCTDTNALRNYEYDS